MVNKSAKAENIELVKRKDREEWIGGQEFYKENNHDEISEFEVSKLKIKAVFWHLTVMKS